MLNKKLKLDLTVEERKPDLMILSETWTNSSVLESELEFRGYQLVVRKDRKDTKNGRGGGLLIYQNENVHCKPLELISELEQIGSVKIGQIEIHGLYRSPNSTPENNEKLIEFLQGRANPTIIIGDANLPYVNWEDMTSGNKFGEEIVETMLVNGFEQLVHEVTHEKGNTRGGRIKTGLNS